jgi:tetratricopeptide (TPR) repeat protein
MFQMDLQKAERFVDDRRVQEAEDICQSVLAERPDHVRALRLMGEIRLRHGQLEEASRYIDAALALDDHDPKLFNQRGRLRNNLGYLDEAEADFRHALELDPNFADALSNLGHVLRRQGFGEAAEQCFRKALARDPEHSAANLNLGAAMFEQGRPEKAIPLLERGLKENMTHMAGRYNLAVAYHQVGRFDEAVYTYRQVIAAGSTDPDAYSNLAAALQAMGDVEGAVCGFESALQISPGHAPSLAGLAGLLELAGDYEKGVAILAPHLKRGTATPIMHVAYAQLLRRMDRGAEALRHLAPLATAAGVEAADLSAVLFTLGDLLDDMGRYDRAFEAYRKANRLKGARYSRKGREREITRLMKAFSRENLASMPRSGRDTETPVFIVGMPRSGTSLVEQILASHSLIHGAGELREIGLMAIRLGINDKNVPYPECVLDMDIRGLRECSGAYIARIEGGASGAARVTDKMWQNFEHLGLIELVYPRARVIHCLRDPLDTGFSCFQQSFGTAGPPFAADLANIGHYYGQYRRLMGHWSRVSGLRTMEIRYEDLVADLEGESRRLVDFLDLEWEPECLRFYENPRLVRTASHAQVKRPVYSSSVGRADHYRGHLQPLVDSLKAGGFLDG